MKVLAQEADGQLDGGDAASSEQSTKISLRRLTGKIHAPTNLYLSQIELRIEDVKFEPHAGRELRTNLGEPVNLGESTKEIEDGSFELVFGAVKDGVDDFLAQAGELSTAEQAQPDCPTCK